MEEIVFTLQRDHKHSNHDIQAGSTVKIVKDPDFRHMWFVYHPATALKPCFEWDVEYINILAGREVVK